MISPRSHQPSRRSENAADYDRLFIPRVHRLIKLGYDRLSPRQHANDEEPAITGDLAEAIDTVLDYPTARWMRFYSTHEDPPVNEPKRRGQRRRRGKSRKRVDIRLDSSQVSPRTRFLWECKRLGVGKGVERYLGDDGLGRFLRGEYARDDVRAGMLGYVQSHDEETWAARIEQRLMKSAPDYALGRESPWRREAIIPELQFTFRSGHGRGESRDDIEIYHTFLRFH